MKPASPPATVVRGAVYKQPYPTKNKLTRISREDAFTTAVTTEQAHNNIKIPKYIL